MKALGHIGRRRGAVLFVSAIAMAIGVQPLAASPQSGGSGPGHTQNRAYKGSAMSFYIARGALGACGPGCKEWIAADGVIDRGSARRLRKLLRRLAGRKLPIYFYSRGGLIPESIEIGRLLHRYRLTAGVARTIPEDCRTVTKADRNGCDERKRSGRPLAARFKTDGAYCLSACVYALVGAPVRDISSNASLGVHATKVTLLRPPRRASQARAALARAKKRSEQWLLDYLAEIGMSSELYRIAAAVSHKSMHLLTRNELARLKIARLPELPKVSGRDSAHASRLEGFLSPPSGLRNLPAARSQVPSDRRVPALGGGSSGGLPI